MAQKSLLLGFTLLSEGSLSIALDFSVALKLENCVDVVLSSCSICPYRFLCCFHKSFSVIGSTQ